MSLSRGLVPVTLAAPGANLGAYIATVNQVPVLTAEEERDGDEDERQREAALAGARTRAKATKPKRTAKR